MQVNLNGIETRYVLSNEGGGPWLAFIHQLGGDLSIWDQLAGYFRDDYTVLRHDARGHGGSAVACEPFRMRSVRRSLETVESIHEALSRTPPEGFAMACEALRDFDPRGKHGAIRCPTLTVAGRHDTGTPPAATQAIADAIEGARFELPDAAHLASTEQFHRFAALLESFLQQRV